MGSFIKHEDKQSQLTPDLPKSSAYPALSPLFVELHCFVSVVIFRAVHREGKGERNECLDKDVGNIIKRAEKCHVNKERWRRA